MNSNIRVVNKRFYFVFLILFFLIFDLGLGLGDTMVIVTNVTRVHDQIKS